MQAKHSPTKLTELTPREIEVLRLVAAGNTTKRIAERLFISPTTVNNHVAHILNKMSARTRLEAVRRAEKAGLI
jgi:two-component system response regulator DesR